MSVGPRRVINIRIVAHTCDVSGAVGYDADERTTSCGIRVSRRIDERLVLGDRTARGWAARSRATRGAFDPGVWQRHRRSRLPAPGTPSPAGPWGLPAPESGACRRSEALRGDAHIAAWRSLEVLTHGVGRIFDDFRLGNVAHASAQATLVCAHRRALCLPMTFAPGWCSECRRADSQRAHATRARLLLWLQSITADAQRTDGEGPALSRRRMAWSAGVSSTSTSRKP